MICIHIFKERTKKGSILEFSQKSVSKDGAENRSEVTEHGEGMIPDGRLVFVVTQNIPQVEREHSCT